MAAAILNADEIGAKLSESIRVLSKLQGFSERTVTLGEAGVVLKTCAAKTKVAKPDAVSRSARYRVLRGLGFTRADGNESVTINAGIRGPAGRVWWKTRNGKFQLAGQMSDDASKFTPSKFHFKDGAWIDIKEAGQDYAMQLRKALPLAQASAGLARQSWVQIADDLGIVLEDVPGTSLSTAGIAKARKSLASDGRTYQNGVGTPAYEENKSYVVTLINRLPYWPKIGMDTTLLTVLAGRAQYFTQNVERAVFASHAATVKAYPWLKLVGVEV